MTALLYVNIKHNVDELKNNPLPLKIDLHLILIKKCFVVLQNYLLKKLLLNNSEGGGLLNDNNAVKLNIDNGF